MGKDNQKTSPDKINKIIETFLLNTYTTEEIANICETSTSSVKKYVRKAGYKFKSQSEVQRKYEINEHYFDEIDCEEKAYFLGFLYADGGISEERNVVSLSLQERDGYILEKINSLFQPSKPLGYIDNSHRKNRQNTLRLIISNKYITENLINKGLTPRKSFTVKFPEWLNENLYHHFIRGYFDGDGCISYSKYHKGSHFSIVGTEEFLLKVQQVLVNNINIGKTKLYNKKPKNSLNEEYNLFTLNYGGRFQVPKIGDYLYKDATIFLERKHEKFYSV